MLQKLGFDHDWVEIVMTCITTVRYSFLLNGEPRGYVTPTRGIRQGDPLSPYLYILVVEGLLSLISHSFNQQWLQGISLTPSAPTLHHLLFADDSFLFGTVTEEECQQFGNILLTYELATGLRVSLRQIK